MDRDDSQVFENLAIFQELKQLENKDKKKIIVKNILNNRILRRNLRAISDSPNIKQMIWLNSIQENSLVISVLTIDRFHHSESE